MNENSGISLKESISALADGESNDLDLQRVLNANKDGGSEQELVRETWQRYQLVGSLMRGESELSDLGDISERVKQAIADEPEVKVAPQPQNWWKNMAGKSAVAAAVTFAMIFGVQQYTGVVDQSNEDIVASANSGAVVPQGFEQPSLTARTVGALDTGTSENVSNLAAYRVNDTVDVNQNSTVMTNEQLRDHVEKLMFLHAEQASNSGALGSLPYARATEFENQE